MSITPRTTVPIGGTADDRFGDLRALRLGHSAAVGTRFGLRHPDSTNYIPEGRIAFWGGWGGSIVTADADRGMTFAYVMNRMEEGLLPSPRTVGYLRAVYEAL